MARQGKSTNDEVSFADVMLEKRCRKAQNVFLNQVDRLIDWRPIRTLINKKYTKRQNAAGAPAYDIILLFKMLLLQTWYGLSDCALEERVNDSVTFSRFLGLSMEAVSPDHSTISRFRTALTESGLMDKLLKAFNKQLSAHHISIKEGVLIDASILMGYCASLWLMIVKIHAVMTKRMKRRLTISFFYRNARGQTVKPGG